MSEEHVNKYNAVDPEVYNPGFSEGRGKPGHQDKSSGGILSVDRVKVQNTDAIDAYLPTPSLPVTREISVTSTWQPTAHIDCAGFRNMFMGGEVTSASGANSYVTVQWSPDGINWWFETWSDLTGAVVGSEKPVFKYSLYDQFVGSAGVKTELVRPLPVRARYVRFQAKTSSGTLKIKFHVQLL